MEQMGPVSRSLEFQQATPQPRQIMDSRFGHRELPSPNETPSIFSYGTPGHGVNGESSN